MCLYVKNNVRFRVAQEDITIFKVLRKERILFSLITRWVTPCCFTHVGYKITRWTKLKAEGEVIRTETGRRGFIEGGVIHAFLGKQKARAIIRAIAIEGDMSVFECVIPKGVEYIIGSYGEVGAKEIRFVKQLK